ncbi:MAG: hypothetical protein ACXABD_08695 [Candidatus Thorarchaeota archaeon]
MSGPEKEALQVYAFFSVFSDEKWIAAFIKEIVDSGASIKRISDDSSIKSLADPETPLYILVGTGGSESAISDFIGYQKVKKHVVLLTHPGNNSLPTAMEVRAYLVSQGIQTKIEHANSEGLVEILREACAFYDVQQRIQTSHLGIIGGSSSWLIASNVDAEQVRKKWGIELHMYPIEPFFEELYRLTSATSSKEALEFSKGADTMGVSEDEILQAGIVAENLSSFVKSNQLDAVTLKCFSLLTKNKVSGCYAVSRVNELDDIVAGCEGDIPSTFTMILSKFLTSTPSFMANVASVDLADNTAIFAHCTVSISMVESYEVTSHYESGMSVGIKGKFSPQDVTVLKVGGTDLSEYWVSDGSIVESLSEEDLCRTQIRVKLENPVDYFLEDSLANHHIIFPGHHAARIRRFFEFVTDSIVSD